jgi:hypothetical protein
VTQPVRFVALPTDIARAYRNGAPDANGMPPERAVSDGGGNPCRHCLHYIPKDAGMLILAHRPFPAPQPYAESGPIFLCADDCPRWQGDDVPPIFKRQGEERLVKGYNADDRIVYGLGKVVPVAEVAARAEAVLTDPRVAYVHVRSATNNCYTCRIDPA